ncbi:Hypothetical_protein [Hexamita inflata]|uniref:Hypothetical_protein n=1 Tax=Hexamita inflata TaxID=28002 RepID=A0AA86TC71_9EUKA|nr:Hypothetical protein HINF_LOCUS47 [Hexamita inflata]
MHSLQLAGNTVFTFRSLKSVSNAFSVKYLSKRAGCRQIIELLINPGQTEILEASIRLCCIVSSQLCFMQHVGRFMMFSIKSVYSAVLESTQRSFFMVIRLNINRVMLHNQSLSETFGCGMPRMKYETDSSLAVVCYSNNMTNAINIFKTRQWV